MSHKDELYFPRDTSWLKFNQRVLKQSMNTMYSLVERLNYIKITITNLDEFFSYRVPLYFEKNLTLNDTDTDKMSILKEIRNINEKNLELQKKILKYIFSELEMYGYVEYLNNDLNKLDSVEIEWLYQYFIQKIYPALSPQLIDNYHEFSPNVFDNNCIFIRLENDQKIFIPIPKTIGRVILIEGSNKLVLIETIILYFVSVFELQYPVVNYKFFKVTKDKSLSLNENKEQKFTTQVSRYIQKREQQSFSRLEIATNNIFSTKDSDQEFLKNFFDVTNSTVYNNKTIVDETLVNDLIHYAKDVTADKPQFETASLTPFSKEKIFEILGSKDILLHHPYDSFQTILNFLERAASDYKTVSIKQTLYRVSADSKIVSSLCKAAKNGIVVYVVIELKAKEDERNNIKVAKKLQKCGCIVSYGIVNYKIHGKVSIIFMRDGKKYAHMGTGNYNEKTAELYADLSLLTSRATLVDELNWFFDSLSGGKQCKNTPRIATSPKHIFTFLLNKISDMVVFKTENPKQRCSITFKVNSLTNRKIIQKLYEASQCGIEIELFVRGACSIIPKKKNLSDNIKVVSYVGKYLEHSRIYSFDFGGNIEYWLSSSDLMDRNLFRRYELAVCLEDYESKKYCQEILNVYRNFSELGYSMDNHLMYHRQNKQLDISTIFINLAKVHNLGGN